MERPALALPRGTRCALFLCRAHRLHVPHNAGVEEAAESILVNHLEEPTVLPQRCLLNLLGNVDQPLKERFEHRWTGISRGSVSCRLLRLLASESTVSAPSTSCEGWVDSGSPLITDVLQAIHSCIGIWLAISPVVFRLTDKCPPIPLGTVPDGWHSGAEHKKVSWRGKGRVQGRIGIASYIYICARRYVCRRMFWAIEPPCPPLPLPIPLPSC